MRRVIGGVLLAVMVFSAPIVGTVAVASADEDAGNTSVTVERWAKTVGGPNDDKLATGLRVDGGYLVVGWSNSSTSDGEHDGYVAMLDPSGQVKWEQAYGGPGSDKLFDVERVDDGYLLVGSNTPSNSRTASGWLVKIGSDGEKQWERTYGGDGPEALWSVASSDDGVYVGGWQQEGRHAKAWAMELNPVGAPVWSRTYDTLRSGTDEYVNSVFATDDGELLMTGTIMADRPDPADAWVLKVGGDGEVKWHKTYGGTEYDRVYDATEAEDGGYVVAGRTASTGNGEQDGWMLKIRPNGDEEWQRTFGTPRMDAFFGIHNDPDGGYVVSGMKHMLGPKGADGWVVKTDADGKKEWEHSYGAEFWDKFWPVVEGHGGGYLAIGESTSYGAERSGWLVKIGGPAVMAIEDEAENESGTTMRVENSPVRSVTLSESNASGYLSIAEETDFSALSPPGDPFYAVTMSGSPAVANGSATVELAVDAESVSTEVSDLRVARRTADDWTMLETAVVSQANDTVVLSAKTDGVSTLAVTAVPAPTASITGDGVVSVDESVALSAGRSTAQRNSIASYEWTVDGRTFSGRTANLTFDEPGERSVELIVTDEHGFEDTATATLVVNDEPEVDVETPGSMTVGKAGSFSADVSDEVGEVTVTWRFGSAEVTGESVEHSFGSAGTKTVTVVVEDEYGATVTKDVTVDVESQDDTREQTTTNSGADSTVPGFGVAAALVALVAAALVARRIS